MGTVALRRWFAAACVIFALGVAAAAVLPARALDRVGPVVVDHAYDLAIFYCAAKTVGHGDPYALEPLASCERTFPSVFEDSIAPAPQPEYVLALLAPFSRFDEHRFAFVWTVTLVALAVAAAGVLSALSGFSGVAILIGLLLGPGLVNLELGQFSLLVVLGVAGAAYAVRNGRAELGALALAPALAEPHVAVPAYVGLFILVPRSRAVTLAVAIAALGLSLATFGREITIEYFTRELPLHALAEARNFDQFSATLLAAVAGASDALAVRIGNIQYVALAAIAIYAASRLRRRYADPAFVVAIPAAAAVIGGTFIHYSELVAVWPALLLLARYASGGWRAVSFVLAMLLADPYFGGFSKVISIVGLSLMGWLGAAELTPRRRTTLTAALVVPLVAWSIVLQHAPHTTVFRFPPSADFAAEAPWGVNLAPIAWGRHVRLDHTTLPLSQLLADVPVWAMLGLLVVLAATLAFGRNARTQSADAPANR